MKSNKSKPNPDEPRESVALCLAKIALRPPCFLAFERFLLVEEGAEDMFDVGCGRVGLDGSNEVFDACVMLDECFVFEMDKALYFDVGEEMLTRVFLPQDSHS
jgi:hypothetical protein